MTTAAIRISHDHTSEATLFVACELSEKTWKLGCTTAYGEKHWKQSVQKGLTTAAT